jgi:hypothetical protein
LLVSPILAIKEKTPEFGRSKFSLFQHLAVRRVLVFDTSGSKSRLRFLAFGGGYCCTGKAKSKRKKFLALF